MESSRWQPPAHVGSYERSVAIGSGDATWSAACTDVLSWKVKSRSGFRVESTDVGLDSAEVGGTGFDSVEFGGAEFDGAGFDSGGQARQGDRHWLTASAWLWQVHEPIEVVAVIRTDDRCGLAYGTLDGHPVSGEEAFIVSRNRAGTVTLTIRSLTTPGGGRWRAAWPAVRLAQHYYRRRYLRSLTLHD
ncbi:MAG: DUF1990 domain-containing protein [Actinomycetota bacterium]|nr:MAG: DUF1990 domain-containing protein [Actinomycetota bacterium]